MNLRIRFNEFFFETVDLVSYPNKPLNPKNTISSVKHLKTKTVFENRFCKKKYIQKV